MSDPAFFGYGSLVNLATHAYANPRPARLPGWRRVWQQTNLREAAFLSVVRDEESHLQGVLAEVPGADWALLDQREAAYQRHDVSDHVGRADTAVYQVKAEHALKGGEHPILLSYLDVVVQGYHRMFGTEGVAHFFATTDGWHLPILDDRADPIYPRHQRLASEERALVDHHLGLVKRPD